MCSYYEGRKNCTFHDVPHLIINLRNTFEKWGFIQNSEDFTWDYITLWYELDNINNTHLAYKLTDNNFDLKGRRRISVKTGLATQVVSHSVGSGVHF